MKLWKVILVTLVIFSTGAITGAVVARKTLPSTPETSWRASATNRMGQAFRPPDRLMRKDFVRRIQSELELTPEQADQMEAIVQESQARTRQLWEQVAPQLRAEFKATQERIQEVLTPEQEQRFEELMKKRRPTRHEERDRREPGPEPPGGLPPPADIPPPGP